MVGLKEFRLRRDGVGLPSIIAVLERNAELPTIGKLRNRVNITVSIFFT
jgi:hypothetical protein